MKKIGDVTSTADKNGEFTDGNVAAGTPPTQLMGDWFNSVQREIINVLIKAGVDQSKTKDDQLAEAISKLIGSAGYQQEGYSYSKAESNIKFQPAGAYATKDELTKKLDKTGGVVDGSISAKLIEVFKEESYIQLDVANNPNTPSINSKLKDKPWRNHILQDASGTIMHIEDIAQNSGQSVNKAVSQKFFTDSMAAKFDKTGGRIKGQTSVRGGFDADAISVSGANEAYIQLDIAQPGTARINTKRAGKQWRNHILQDASGTIMQLEDIMQGTGQETSKVMSQQASTKMAFGISQEYKDVTAERLKGTTYTNATDSAICVLISTVTQPTRNLYIAAIVRGKTIAKIEGFDSSHTNQAMTFIVPKGATYSVDASATISMWTELR